MLSKDEIVPVDREKWAEQLSSLQNWDCPTCGKGALAPMEGKLWFEETGPSIAEHGHDAWEPDWMVKRFAGFLKCSWVPCGEVAVVSGTSPTDFFEDWEAGHRYTSNEYIVRSIEPTPLPIDLPKAAPEAVGNCIRGAAALVWSSSEAAANHLRQAVEHMMDDLGVPKTSEGGKGKALNLHQRIEQFQKTDPGNGEILLATKWLGNSGSHASGLSRDDVLDAFDMLEHVLEELYGTAKKALLAKVAAVNAAKGPLVKKPL